MARAYFGDLLPGDPEIKRVFDSLEPNPPKLIACDVETISLTDQRVLGLAIATPEGHAFYFDIYEPTLPWPLFFRPDITKLWHNGPFDLAREALGKFKVDTENMGDTVVVMRLLPDIGNTLEEASQHVRTQARNMGDVLREHSVTTCDQLPWAVLAEKCATDALATMQVWQKFRPQIDNEYYEVQNKFQKRLIQMSYRGIKLDKERVRLIDRELEANLLLYNNLARRQGFNPHSPRQVAAILNSRGWFLPTSRSGAPSTSEETLRDIPDALAQLTIICRKYNKLHGTYIHKWKDLERAYTHYRMDAATGRTSSYKDNLQNTPTGQRGGDIVPRAGSVRSVFIPDTEYGTHWDLAQIELRALAYLSGDLELQAALNDPARDLHKETMILYNIPSRVQTKNVTYGIVFNGSDYEIAIGAGISDLNVIRRAKYAFAKAYPQCWAWMQAQQEIALQTMRVTTLFGRVLRIDQGNKGLSEKHVRNCGINWPIQGTAAEAFQRIALAVEADIPSENWLAQSHDDFWNNGVWKLSKDLEHIVPFWTPIELEHVTRFSGELAPCCSKAKVLKKKCVNA